MLSLKEFKGKVQEIENKFKFDIQKFNSAPIEAQRRILGEMLYPIVMNYSNDKVVGKITGMLLELDKDYLVRMIHNHAEISIRVKEAIEVLKRAWANKPEANLLPP